MDNKELEQVSGGIDTDAEDYSACPNCRTLYIKTYNYPKDHLVKKEDDGCSGSTFYYKFPNCGHEWTES